MAYIGVSPSNGVRQKHTYTATSGQTTFTGSNNAENVTLSYRDSNYVDVYVNGVKLGDADYTATSGTSIVFDPGLSVNDIVEIIVYDVFSVADTVSKADGGVFDGNVTMAGTLAVTGETTLSTHLNMGDNDIIKLGDSADLQIYHDAGGNSFINESGSGSLFMQGDNIRFRTTDGTGTYALFTNSGAVDLYHNNSLKLATTSTGIDVTGTVVSDGMSTNTAGTSNFIAGVNAGNSIASGSFYNVLVGDNAGMALTTGDGNVAIGYDALKTEDADGYNVAIGYRALETLNRGGEGYTVSIGKDAGRLISTGVANTIIGSEAGDVLSVGNQNVALGYASLSSDTQGNYSTAIGSGALSGQNFTSPTDSYNTAVGFNAGNVITTGINNTLIGGKSGDAFSDGNYNTGVGAFSLSTDTRGLKATALGYAALASQNFTSQVENHNTALGYFAGANVTSGVQNTIVGSNAGDAFNDADFNVALGFSSLSSDTKGSRSTALGYKTLESQNFTTSTDAANTAVGFQAGLSITTGIRNVLIGAEAGDLFDEGFYNVAVGYQTLSADVRGSGSVAIGYKALSNQQFGSATNTYNTAVGYTAGQLISTGTKNTIIGGYNGNQNGLDIRTSSNNIVLADGDGNPRIVVNSSGRIKLGGTDQEGHVHAFGNFASGYSAVFQNDGNNSNRYGILSKSGADDASGTNYAFDIADGNGTVQGSITFSGGTVTYGAFTAFHPCIIPNADNDADSTANAYPYGTLLEITNIGYTQKDGVNTERGILYNVQKSSSAKSKSVLGAYGSSMNNEERGNTNLHQALVLGDGHILCNNENGNIAVGDYICTSSTSGEGMKATSICTTIGIAREAVTFTDSTAVLVAVEYGYRQFVPEDLEARIAALEGA